MKRLGLLIVLVLMMSLFVFVSAECTDSDGGADYNTKGTTIGLNTYNETTEAIDYCVYYGQQGTYGMYLNPGETAVMEYVCNSDGETVNDELSVCGSYGCGDGKCLERDDVEDVVCEIDFYYDIENDASCMVEYNGVTKECTIEAEDGEPGNQCILPDLYIMKPTPDEGYMDVVGLSGTFEGILCGEIETAYNTNRFFVNCKNPGTESEVETEQVVCEIEYGTKLDNIVTCNVNYNGEIASCEIEADDDPYNICYPIPKIDIAKPSPNEGYSPVPGLSGDFSNIQCKKIETVYNTNGFFVNCNPSYDEESEDVITPTEETGPIDLTEENIVCNGCLKEEKCYPFGYRKDGTYCSDDNNFIDYKDSEVSCDNNFECGSNLCIDDECVSAGFFRRIMNWFKRLFG